ncbi:MAG TPA: flagellar assembly protein FliW [Spirochaetota bacterium]|nr:flagellar assembly protein FliW [Spirochaetota bacterium]HPC41750.1 flagellar assembly protein FliW [Spirochaetota bacterium]HPL19327.1 flagellar assembly protein FliW [Spirochaetota bacterium]HQF06651.1 flagellar assembly protein FliW [Spirochaetota bacterium]HQH95946.1 flagellar assembly protein FliW [Spirochaetota bacterium]
MGIKIKTRPFGEIEVTEQQIIDFPDGILGFDDVRKFVLLDAHDENSPLKWLQAYDEPELAFVIIRPVDFMREYELVVSMNDIEAVGADTAENLVVFAIVTIPTNPSDMTANLQGPIIVNPEKRLGRQAISLSDRYSVRHKILEEMKKAAEG